MVILLLAPTPAEKVSHYQRHYQAGHLKPGVNYLMWFEIGIEGKDPMDPKEEDWGGTIEFGFSEKNFCKDIEDYFLLFEDEFSL